MNTITSAVVSGVLSLVVCLSAGAAEGTRPTLARVVALPSPDRVSLVFELTDAVAHAALTAGQDSASATIELGPVKTVVARELGPAVGVNLVTSVAVRSFEQTPDTFARIVVRLRTTCRQKLRVAGRRIYLDLVPLQSPPPSPASSSPSLVAQSKGPVTTREPKSPVTTRESKSPVPAGEPKSSVATRESKAAVATGDQLDAAYHTLEADGLRRARALATQANVKALEALRAEMIRRDGQLGRKRPEVVSQLIDEIDRCTEEARALRLKLDGLLFRKPQDGIKLTFSR
jgi:hypothetical protein